MHGLRIASSLLGLLALLAGGGLHAAGPDPAAEIKAAYLYNFARFVEWPATAYAAQPNVFELCTPDEQALDGHLLRIHGREAQGRRIVVRVLAAGDDPASCQLLFLPRALVARHEAWLEALAPRPVLTVSDAPSFARGNGMVALYVAGDRVQFAINRPAADAAGLRVGARLLALAQDAPEGAK